MYTCRGSIYNSVKRRPLLNKIVTLALLASLIIAVVPPVHLYSIEVAERPPKGEFQVNLLTGPFQYYMAKSAERIASIAVSQAGNRVFYGDGSGRIGYLYMSLEGVWSWSLRGGTVALASTTDFSKFAVASEGKQVILINSLGVIEALWERGFRGTLQHLVMDSKALKVAVSDNLGYIYLLNVAKPLGRREAQTNASIADMSFLLTRDGFTSDSLAVAVNDYRLKLEGGIEYVGGVLLVYDLTVGEDNEPLNTSLAKAIPIFQSVGPLKYFKGVDGHKRVALATSIEDKNYILVLNVDTDAIEVQKQYPLGYPIGGSAVDVKVTRDGSCVVVASEDYNVYVLKWNGRVYEYYWSISLGAPVTALDVSWDGKTIAAGTLDGWVYLIDIGGDVLWKTQLGVGGNSVESISVDGSGDTIVVGFSNGSIVLLRGVRRRMVNLIINIETLGFRVEGGFNVSVWRETPELEMYNLTLNVNEAAHLLLPPGRYSLRVENENLGYYATVYDLTVDSYMSIPVVKLSIPTFKLKISVLDLETGSPVGNAIVSVYSVREGREYRFQTAGNGSFEVELPKGTYRVVVSKSGFTTSNTITVNLVMSRSLFVRLKPVRVPLKLQVLGLNETPLANAKVYINNTLAGTTAANGTLSVSLRLGRYNVSVMAEHYKTFNASVTVSRPEVLKVHLAPKLYTLNITLLDGESRVRIRDAKLSVSIGKKVVLERRVTVENNSIVLPYGNYTFKVEAKHYIPLQLKVAVENSTVLTLELIRTAYPVIVNVKNDLGEPMENVRVTAEVPQLGFKQAFTTDSTGKSILQLKFGAYQLKVEASGYKEYERVISVTGPSTINVILEPTITTILQRLLPYIVGVAVAAAIAVLLLVRVRRRRIVPEEEEELLEV